MESGMTTPPARSVSPLSREYLEEASHQEQQHQAQHQQPQQPQQQHKYQSRILETRNSLDHIHDDDEKASPDLSGKTWRSWTAVWLFLAYAILATLSWTIIVILTYRPVTTSQYGISIDVHDPLGRYLTGIHSKFLQNEDWFHAAAVIQTIAAVAVIPITSAVCASAAVIFVQRRQDNSKFTLRHTIALADRSWADLGVYVRLLTGSGKRYGSRFLYLAIVLTIIGGIIAPLQSVFMTTRNVRTPTDPVVTAGISDIGDHFSVLGPSNDQTMAAYVRSALTAYNSDRQAYLWSSVGAANCSNGADNSSPCVLGHVTLNDLPRLQDPFVAQLPAGFSTGLARQFAPRINSSVTRLSITEADFPVGCETLANSFYASYSTAVNANLSWALTACMPTDQSLTLWKNTRARQDFSEDLYMNISVRADGYGLIASDSPQNGLFKITLKTTVGFFELPNYMNEQTPSGVLPNDPSNYCGQDCLQQGMIGNIRRGVSSRDDVVPRQTPDNGTVDTNDSTLESKANKGPLLTIAMALFGTGSFIAERVANPDSFINTTARVSTSQTCDGRMPFWGLVAGTRDYGGTGTFNQPPCVSNQFYDDAQLQLSIIQYIQSFLFLPGLGLNDQASYDSHIQTAFAAAAFLTNSIWLDWAPYSTLTVNSVSGTDTQVPAVSLGGVIVVSVLLGFYLLSLLALAMYSVWTPRWTHRLDAVAMMRLGGSFAERVPLQVIE